jgi:hypothetical protein
MILLETINAQWVCRFHRLLESALDPHFSLPHSSGRLTTFILNEEKLRARHRLGMRLFRRKMLRLLKRYLATPKQASNTGTNMPSSKLFTFQ